MREKASQLRRIAPDITRIRKPKLPSKPSKIQNVKVKALRRLKIIIFNILIFMEKLRMRETLKV